MVCEVSAADVIDKARTDYPGSPALDTAAVEMRRDCKEARIQPTSGATFHPQVMDSIPDGGHPTDIGHISDGGRG